MKNLLVLFNFRYIYPALLGAISILLCYLNYVPGTWLSGWDTLHPEMNFGIYWSRILNSAWQYHQGLGAVATQAHAAEIPRVLLMQFFGLYFPMNFLRWFYFFSMLLIGPLGVYYSFQQIVRGERKYKLRAYSFIAGLFYLLNLGTLQNFFVPLEMFATLYGLIGWLFLFSNKILKEKFRLTNVIIFSIATIFASPMAHTPTLWFMYFMILFLYVVSTILSTPKKAFRRVFYKGLIVISTTLILNSYWILPTSYFIIYHSKDVANAKITRLVSEEGILNNQEYANIKDVSVLKGYLFNWRVHRGDGLFTPIFQEWEIYYNSYPVVMFIGHVAFIIAILGLFLSIYRFKKNRTIFIFTLSVGLPSFFLIMMSSPPFGWLFNFLFSNIEILKEAFRFPYTKVSIFLMFNYSILFAYALMQLRYVKFRFFSEVVVFFVTALLIIYTLPAFKGNLFGDIVKVNIPQNYFEVFNELNKTQNSRILYLPIPSLYGWVYYDWNQVNRKIDASYQGAGFTWFLSKNPIIDREFDRWFPTNEDLYNELHYAIYSENDDLLSNILNKYNIKTILFDGSLDVPGEEKILYQEQILKLLDKVPNLKKYKDDQFGFLKIYRYQADRPTNKYNSEVPSFSFSNYDPVSKSGKYITDKSLLSKLADDDLLATTQDKIIIEKPNIQSEQFIIDTPDESSSFEKVIPASVTNLGSEISLKFLYPSIEDRHGKKVLDISSQDSIKIDEDLEVLFNGDYIPSRGFEKTILIDRSVNKLVTFSSKDPIVNDVKSKLYESEATDCFGGNGAFGKEMGNYPYSVIIKSYDKNTCLPINLLIQNDKPTVYRISFQYKSSSGGAIVYCLKDISDGSCINQKYSHSPQQSEQMSTFTDFVYSPQNKTLQLVLILETSDKKSEQYALFKDLVVEQMSITGSLDYSVPLSITQSSKKITVNRKDFPLAIKLPNYDDLNQLFLPGGDRFSSNKMNCDFVNDGKFDRKLIDKSDEKYFEYTSTNAISCDYIDIGRINTKSSSVLRFKNKNFSGKNLDICVEDRNSGKCLISDRLKNIFVNEYILPAFPNVDQYGVGISNHSIGEIESKNDFYGLEVQYFPYYFLKNIRIYGSEGSASILSNLTTNDASFENGWHIYSKKECIWGIGSPLTCKKIDNKHLLINNWENGWIVGEDKNDLYIVFWPQYLQFIGYGLIVIFFYVIFFLTYRKHNRNIL